MPVFHTKTIESILEPVAQQVFKTFLLFLLFIFIFLLFFIIIFYFLFKLFREITLFKEKFFHIFSNDFKIFFTYNE